jgi:hypothetical protein
MDEWNRMDSSTTKMPASAEEPPIAEESPTAEEPPTSEMQAPSGTLAIAGSQQHQDASKRKDAKKSRDASNRRGTSDSLAERNSRCRILGKEKMTVATAIMPAMAGTPSQHAGVYQIVIVIHNLFPEKISIKILSKLFSEIHKEVVNMAKSHE